MVVTTNAVDDPSIENYWSRLLRQRVPEEDQCARHLG
jgi:hypothetical protein